MVSNMGGFGTSALIFGVSSLVTVSIGYLTYLNRITILENCNYHYLNVHKYINNLNPITVLETIKLKSKTIYHIKLLDTYFIVNDLDINIDEYTRLKTSLHIPHSPEDIMEGVLIKNDEEIDITDISKLLIGPLLNQISEVNEKWIFEYLESRHNYTNISSFEITLINGIKNSLKNRNI